MIETPDVSVEYTPEEIALAQGVFAERAKSKFSDFFKMFPPNRPYIYGRHTIDKLNRIDHIISEFEAGRSTFTIFEEPPRHGKSDISSKRLPAWFHMRFPTEDVIIAANIDKLACTFSEECRKICEATGGIFGLAPSKGRWAIDTFRMDKCSGTVQAVGVGATIMGLGGALIDIDDPYTKREQVESDTERGTVKDWFRSVIFTRRAPVCAVVINMQRWHWDDIVGWIRRMNDPTSEEYDPDFPKFTIVSYLAQSKEYETEANPNGWLFPERFDDGFYRATKALVGTYAWNSQYLQEPAPRHGSFFPVRVEGEDENPTVRIVDSLPDGAYERGWDIASSEKQLKKDDPDFTAGVKAGILDYAGDGGRWLCVKHATRFRQLAGERNDRIVRYAKMDGPSVRVRMETVAGYVDAYRQVKESLVGWASVQRSVPHYDKRNRAGALLTFFEGGRVVLERGEWNKDWLDEFRVFDGGAHDDLVDATIIAVDEAVTHRQGKPVIRSDVGNLAIRHRPLVYYGGNGVLRKRFSTAGRDPEKDPAGRLLIGTYLGRREPSAAVLVFVDEDKAWHVLDSVECAAGGNQDTFARDWLVMIRNSEPIKKNYLDMEMSLLSADDDQESLYLFEERLYRAAKDLDYGTDYTVPEWMESRLVDGKSGIELIESKAEATANRQVDGLYVWPSNVLLALRDARSRAQAVGREGVEGKEEMDVNNLVRCLKMLGAKYRE